MVGLVLNLPPRFGLVAEEVLQAEVLFPRGERVGELFFVFITNRPTRNLQSSLLSKNL